MPSILLWPLEAAVAPVGREGKGSQEHVKGSVVKEKQQTPISRETMLSKCRKQIKLKFWLSAQNIAAKKKVFEEINMHC